MKSFLVLPAFFVLTIAVQGQHILAEYHWNDPAQNGLLPSRTPLLLDGREVLKFANTNDAPLQVSLLTIREPKISPQAQVYGLVGELRYDSVHGDGFLEMWSYFPSARPGSAELGYFSRTLGDTGPMEKISGTSDWRQFTLPFDRTGASSPPARLQVNLILPGRGTVYLGPLKLVEFSNVNTSLGGVAPEAWWSDRAAGWVGGLGVGLIGCLCSLAAWLARQGKARGFVTSLLQILTGVGVLVGLTGAVAVARHQPYAVWFPLALGATLVLSVCPLRLRQVSRKYEELELRRMESLDTSGAQFQ